MTRSDREGPVHRAVLSYLTQVLPGAVIHHSPNETDLSGPQAMRMVARAKALGMLPGWPDLIVLWRGQFWAFEVKAPGNYPTIKQKQVGEAIEAQGGRWAVVRSVDDAEACVTEWKAAGDWQAIGDVAKRMVRGAVS